MISDAAQSISGEVEWVMGLKQIKQMLRQSAKYHEQRMVVLLIKGQV
jgi:hypothetical protein